MKLAAAAIATAIVLSTALDAHAEATNADPWFAHDKYLHGSVSAGLALTGYGAAALTTKDVRWRLGAGATLALSAGVAKEMVDLAGPGDASWRDFTWDVVGTATGLAIAYLLDAYVF